MRKGSQEPPCADQPWTQVFLLLQWCCPFPGGSFVQNRYAGLNAQNSRSSVAGLLSHVYNSSPPAAVVVWLPVSAGRTCLRYLGIFSFVVKLIFIIYIDVNLYDHSFTSICCVYKKVFNDVLILFGIMDTPKWIFVSGQHLIMALLLTWSLRLYEHYQSWFSYYKIVIIYHCKKSCFVWSHILYHYSIHI